MGEMNLNICMRKNNGFNINNKEQKKTMQYE